MVLSEGFDPTRQQAVSDDFDNASIYTAKKLKPYWNLLAEKGMRFYFLPPYSPELNRIELLWHQ